MEDSSHMTWLESCAYFECLLHWNPHTNTKQEYSNNMIYRNSRLSTCPLLLGTVWALQFAPNMFHSHAHSPKLKKL